MEVPEKRKGAIFCSQDGEWKEELEKRLQTDAKLKDKILGELLASEVELSKELP